MPATRQIAVPRPFSASFRTLCFIVLFSSALGLLLAPRAFSLMAGRVAGAARLVSGTITDDHYLSNRAASKGGALRLSGDVTITHAIFQANTSNLSGAIVHDQSGTLLLADDLFARNSVTVRWSGSA